MTMIEIPVGGLAKIDELTLRCISDANQVDKDAACIECECRGTALCDVMVCGGTSRVDGMNVHFVYEDSYCLIREAK